MADIFPITPGVVVHRAKWIMITPDHLIENGYLLTADGIIRETGTGRLPNADRMEDHGDSLLMPGLINAHTHLELCALQNRIPFEGGFQSWVRRVLQEREAVGTDQLVKGAETGIDAVTASGTIAVGDVSTLGITRNVLCKSPLSGVWFHEYLGGALPEHPVLENNASNHHLDGSKAGISRINLSLAGHAPHTTSPALLKYLKEKTRSFGLPFSIHLDESEDERTFLATGKGSWADFLTERGIDFSAWGLPSDSPVAYADRLGILDEKTLAVHLIDAGPGEFDILRRRNVNICLCPRSNQNLHNRLPDLPGMLTAGLRPCLGTDSPASVNSLSLFDEMAFSARSFPGISPSDFLAMATINGARALQSDHYLGSLEPGKLGIFIQLPVTAASSPSQLLEQIIHDALHV